MIFIVYTLLVLLTNILLEQSVIKNNDIYEIIGGIIIGFVAIPIFSIILPLIYARKWNLNYSFLPKTKKTALVISIFIAYIIIFSYSGIISLYNQKINIINFVIHLISVSLFHITYYPLFVILIFPVIRKNFGLLFGVLSTAVLFAFYHLAQFYNFPTGTDISMQVFLFVDFSFLLLLYLWSESIILTSLTHIIIGAIDYAYKGKIETDIDFIFFEAVIVLFGLLIYMFLYNKRTAYNKEWWINISVSDK